MDVKVNKEVRNYTESMFFGLSMRQFFFSVLACAFAVLFYFLLNPYLGIETLSWVCILAAAPFAALGFITYNGMYAEQFAWAFIKAKILIPSKIIFKSEPFYYQWIQEGRQRKERSKHDQNAKKFIKTGK